MKKLVCKTPNCGGTFFTKTKLVKACVNPLGEWHGYVCSRCGKITQVLITNSYKYSIREVMIPEDALIDRLEYRSYPWF